MRLVRPVDSGSMFAFADGSVPRYLPSSAFADADSALRRESGPNKIAPMTIAIAILCEDGQAVVVAGDRNVSPTVGSPGAQVTFSSDTDCEKIVRLNSRTFVAYSGQWSDREAIERRLGDMSVLSPSELAHRLRLASEEHCRSILDKWFRERGTNLEDVAKSLIAQGAVESIRKLPYPNLAGDFLVAGFDSERARVFAVDDQTANDQISMGFDAIGAAAPIAIAILVARKTQKGITLAKAICLAHEAKRVAESVQGIGRKTQIAYVTKDIKATFLTASQISKLDSMYDRRLPFTEQDEAAVQAFIPIATKSKLGSPQAETSGQVAIDPATLPETATLAGKANQSGKRLPPKAKPSVG